MRAGTVHAAMRALPEADLDAVVPGTALVLAPHADDESLGCGGLIAEACARGRPPLVVVATDGVGSHPNSSAYPPERLRATREAETLAAVACLGLSPDRVAFLRLPDTAAPAAGPDFELAVQSLSALARAFGCDSLLATWAHDPHGDHLACWRIAERLAAQDAMPLLAYPVWGWMIPPEREVGCAAPRGVRLAIGGHLEAKGRAIAAHRSQYGGLVIDDPDGFQLPPALLAVFRQPFETFLVP